MLIWFLLYRCSKRKFDIFDSFYLISALYALVFIYGPYVWIQRNQTSYQGVEVMSYMPQAMLVFNIGYFFYAAFSFNRRNYQTTIAYSQNQNTATFSEFLDEPSVRTYIIKYAWIVFGVSMALSLLYYRLIGRSLWFMLTLGQGAEYDAIRGGYGLYFLMQFVRSAIPGCILLIAFSKKNKLLIYICTYILCAVCISTGSRNLAICVILAIIVYSYLEKNKRPSPVVIIAGIVVLYLFVGAMGIFRGAIKTGGSIDLTKVNSDSLFSAFMFNVEIFYPFFTLIGYVGSGRMSLHYGLGFLNVFVQFIPRAIWSSKPAMLGLTAFQAMYGDSMGGAAYPNIGEFYYEFGILGVIILMALFGIQMKKAYRKVITSHNKVEIISYSILFGYMLQFVCRGHLASWAIDFVFMFGPLWYLNRRLKRWYNRQKC